MGGAIIENLSGRKLFVLVSALVVFQIATFLIGGLVAPAPTTVSQMPRRLCLDKNYEETKWYYTRGKEPCHVIESIKSTEVSNRRDVSADNLIFTFQIPVPKDGIELDYTRWQQNMIALLMLDIPVEKDAEISEKDATLTMDIRLGYKNKNETTWKQLARSTEDRKLNCEEEEIEEENDIIYKCNPIPLFELASIYHDYYLLNVRFPNSIGGRKNLNRFQIQVDDIEVVFIIQNGGFTKVWLSLKTIFLPIVVAVMIWFWLRISKLSRSPSLLEYLLMGLGGAITFVNIPIEFLSLHVYCPWMTLLSDIRHGIFYAVLLSFWLIFAGEHLMDDVERNRIRVYWRHLSAVLTCCVCLFVFDLCERGLQVTNPFYSIWSTETGTNLALAFIIIAAISAFIYFFFLCYMIYKVFCNIGSKQRSLPAMAASRRVRYEGIIYRFKALMLATLLCAAVTVIAFITGEVYEGKRYDDGYHMELSSAFLTGVYGMWNIYTIALICLYAPSHKKYPEDSSLASIHGALLARDNLSTTEEIEFSHLVPSPSETSSLTNFAKKTTID